MFLGMIVEYGPTTSYLNITFFSTVTAASSELDKVGNTFLQLKLVINTGNGTKNSYMGKLMSHAVRKGGLMHLQNILSESLKSTH